MSKESVYRCDGVGCNKVLDDYHVRVGTDIFCRERPGVDPSLVEPGDYCMKCLAKLLRIPMRVTR